MLDAPGIRALLPHGHPMVLVDRVLDMRPGESVVAIKAVSLSEPCFSGLARDAGAAGYRYPPSLMLESFGQTAALMWLADRPEPDLGDRLLMLVAARDCAIEDDVVPGDVMRHEARVEHVTGDNLFVAGETRVGDRLVATIGSMMAVIRPMQSRQNGRVRS